MAYSEKIIITQIKEREGEKLLLHESCSSFRCIHQSSCRWHRCGWFNSREVTAYAESWEMSQQVPIVFCFNKSAYSDWTELARCQLL